MFLTFACTFTTDGLEAFAADHGANDVDFLVLPELFDGGYARLHRDRGPAPTISRLIDRLRQISQDRALHLVSGTLALPDEKAGVRNASLVFSRGKLAGQFAKTHLYRPLGDDQFFGSSPPGATITLPGPGCDLRIGVIVCYDLRFPETVRPWFKSGLDILFVPARWPRERDEVWRVLLRARAIENQCFVVGINARDNEGGGSYAYGPGGDEIFVLGPDPLPGEPLWHTFTADLEDIARVKSRLDTRPDAKLL